MLLRRFLPPVYAVSYKFPGVGGIRCMASSINLEGELCASPNSDEDESVFYNSFTERWRFTMSVVLLMSALMPLVYGILIKGSFDEGLPDVPILPGDVFQSNISGFYGGIFTAHIRRYRIMGTTTAVSAVLCAVCVSC